MEARDCSYHHLLCFFSKRFDHEGHKKYEERSYIATKVTDAQTTCEKSSRRGLS